MTVASTPLAAAGDRVGGGSPAEPMRAARRLPSPRNHAPWEGQWIGAPDIAPPSGAIPGLDGEARRAGHETLLFRADFTLERVPSSAVLRVASDSRHVAWVNGAEAARGPARSQPSRMIADEVDITHLLRTGPNALAVQVTYYGAPNALWMPARSSGGLGSAAALLAEVSGPEPGSVLAATDSSWLVMRGEASSRLERSDVEGVPAEIHDARLDLPGWQTTPPSSGWTPAAPLAAGHICGAGRAKPPVDPYGPVPSQRRTATPPVVSDPVAVVHRDPGSAAVAADAFAHPSDRVREAELAAGPTRATDDARLQDGGIVIIDFGRVVFGQIDLDVDAPAGVELDLDLRESVAVAPGEGRHGLRYVTRGRDDRFRSAEPHGFRAIALRARGGDADSARLRGVRVLESGGLGHERAHFTSSDPELDTLWAAGLRTLEACSSDAYIDCPTREQRAWVGDGAIHLEVDLLTSRDPDLPRRYLELCSSPRADGLLPMAVAGDIEDAGATTIPAYSLFWIHGVHTYAMHQGLDEAVQDALPVAERILRWFTRFRDPRGSLSDVPGWGLVDWSSTYTDGRSSVLTALWARSLREFAELSGAIGNEGSARWARRLHESVRTGFDDFWDHGRGLYLDRAPDGTSRSRATSQLASACAVVAGVVPRGRVPGVARRISDPRRLVTRSWLWSGPKGFDNDAMDAWMRRPAEPDWNVEQEIVRAQPFGLGVVHDALGQAGHVEGLLTSMRSWSGFLADGYDTFGEGWGWGTRAHGWSCAPTRDLITHVLGARPVGFGGDEWAIAPDLGRIEHVQAGIETAHGLLELDITPEATCVDAPVSTIVRVAERLVRLQPGRHTVRR